MIRTFDTDVLNLLISYLSQFELDNKDSFIKYWAGKLLELHKNEEVTYENTVFTSKPTFTKLIQ